MTYRTDTAVRRSRCDKCTWITCRWRNLHDKSRRSCTAHRHIDALPPTPADILRRETARRRSTSKTIRQLCRAFNCRIFYDHYLPTVIFTVILIIIGIPSPTHSFTLGLNPSFSANPPYPSLSFFSFRIYYIDFLDCLLLLLSISVFLLFSFSVFTHF